jgi:hypothetical protein
MDTSINTPRGIITLHPVSEEDALSYRDLRLEALRNHPEAFSADYEVNLAKPMAFWVERLRVKNPENPVMTYFAVHADKFIGMCSIVTRTHPRRGTLLRSLECTSNQNGGHCTLPRRSSMPASIGRATRASRWSSSPSSQPIHLLSVATPEVDFGFTESNHKRYTTTINTMMSS